ncbi:MAG: UDP-2,3-diacylglucosamine diphosphatase [Arenibacter sp.]|nr:UDP-2,3-diacylglucosamine diphosphatase [Arenibacter sp.]
MKKRQLDIAVISDIHLGTLSCHADELLSYLNSIKPKTLILNGDIIDIGQFSKRYFPATHLKVLRKIMGMATNGTEVYYITGNHDDMIRRFSGTSLGNIHVVDKLSLELNGKRAWFFHGDIFDITIKNAKWVAKLGAYSYDLLLLVNKITNSVLFKLGREKYSLAKKIKHNVTGARKFIKNFEQAAKELAIENNYDYVICGHIHQPNKEIYENELGKCTYLNSGDWVENLTALEYTFKRWKIYRYSSDKLSPFYVDEELKSMNLQDLMAAASIQMVPQTKSTKKEKI